MTSLRAFSEILRDTEGLTDAEQHRYATIIHDEALRLTRLLDDLLDLSVLENGQVVLNTETDSLRAVLDRCVAVAEGEPGALTVQRDPEAEEVLLTSDLDRLSQVFINLISNARKYCDAPDPVLTIRAECVGEDLRVVFADNGSGIPAARKAVIFEKFVRGGHSDERGAGLGLAICREIMLRLGGTIRLLPGTGGAVFEIRMPMRVRMAAQ